MTQSKSIFDTFIDGITESTQDYLAEQSADSAESTTQSKECIFNCNKRFKNLWLQFFLSQNQGFMRLFEKTVLK